VPEKLAVRFRARLPRAHGVPTTLPVWLSVVFVVGSTKWKSHVSPTRQPPAAFFAWVSAQLPHPTSDIESALALPPQVFLNCTRTWLTPGWKSAVTSELVWVIDPEQPLL